MRKLFLSVFIFICIALTCAAHDPAEYTVVPVLNTSVPFTGILTWNKPARISVATTYNLYRMTGTCPNTQGLAGFSIVNSTPISGTSYKDTTEVKKKTYCYTVTQVQAGKEFFHSNFVTVTAP
jgi:hypothetical protein